MESFQTWDKGLCKNIQTQVVERITPEKNPNLGKATCPTLWQEEGCLLPLTPSGCANLNLRWDEQKQKCKPEHKHQKLMNIVRYYPRETPSFQGAKVLTSLLKHPYVIPPETPIKLWGTLKHEIKEFTPNIELERFYVPLYKAREAFLEALQD
jgi:hypothetical protein